MDGDPLRQAAPGGASLLPPAAGRALARRRNSGDPRTAKGMPADPRHGFWRLSGGHPVERRHGFGGQRGLSIPQRARAEELHWGKRSLTFQQFFVLFLPLLLLLLLLLLFLLLLMMLVLKEGEQFSLNVPSVLVSFCRNSPFLFGFTAAAT